MTFRLKKGKRLCKYTITDFLVDLLKSLRLYRNIKLVFVNYLKAKLQIPIFIKAGLFYLHYHFFVLRLLQNWVTKPDS